MIYLDLVGYKGETEGIDFSNGAVPQIDPTNQRIYITDGNSSSVAVGASKPVVKSLLDLSSSEMSNFLFKDAVVSGRALFEFMNSVFGLKFINPASVNKRHSVYTNIGGVGYLFNLERKSLVRKVVEATEAIDQTPRRSSPSIDLNGAIRIEKVTVGPNKYKYYRIYSDQPANIVMTRAVSDVTYNIDGTVDTDHRQILDGPPDEIRENNGIDDEFMSEVWSYCDQLEDDLKTIEPTKVRVRKADVKDKLVNSVYTKNSVVTDLIFITNLHLKLNGLNNYVTYVVADSESIVHSKTKEVLVQHQYKGVDNANGIVTISAYEGVITLTNYDNLNGKPSKRPVIVCGVYDTFENNYKRCLDSYKRYMLVMVNGTLKRLTICN